MGGSTGINVAGAIRLAKQMGPGHTIVTILCDYGTRYLSKMFNPAFLREKNLPVPDWLERKPSVPSRLSKKCLRHDRTFSTARMPIASRRGQASIAINDRGGIILDRTVFYATAGGQPGDKGMLAFSTATRSPSPPPSMTRRRIIVHVPAQPGRIARSWQPMSNCALDWATRYRNMRAHTVMHLLCATVPFPVTGGAITDDGGRIDFDIPKDQVPDKAELAERINALIAADHAVSFRWISDEEMEANQNLIRTMSVKPPMGTGRVRLVAIGPDGSVDLQPCGGTHVRSTGEIGAITVAGIESKGKQNRRIRLAFA